MKCVGLLVVTVALVCSAPLPDALTEQQTQTIVSQFTPDVFIKGIQQFLAAFGEYVPAVIKTELSGMIANPEEVKAFTEFWQKAMIQKMEPPKDPKAAIEFYKQNLPLTAPRLERIGKSFDEALAKISKPGQDYLTEFNNKLEAIEVPHDDNKTAVNLVNFLIDDNEKYNALADSVKAEISAQYPEIIKFVNTPEFKNFIAKLQPLKGKSDTEVLAGFGEAIAAFAPLYSKLH